MRRNHAEDRSPGPGSGAYELRLIGGFSVERDHRPVELSASSERLVAFLALNDRPTHRLGVAGSLWPDKCDARAGANLRSALWRLKQESPGLVDAMTSRIALCDDARVDYWQLLGWAGRVLSGVADDADLDDSAEKVTAVLLPHWYEDWVVLERERVRQRLLYALEATAALLTEQGRRAEAIDIGHRSIALDPLRETSHRVVIEAHLSAGNYAEAHRQYENYRMILSDELGIEPSPQLQQLVAPTFAHR